MFLKISSNSQENNCVGVSFLNKRYSCTGVFLLTFAKFLRTFFLQSTPERLLLIGEALQNSLNH